MSRPGVQGQCHLTMEEAYACLGLTPQQGYRDSKP